MSRAVMQQALEALIPLANAASPNERECLTDEDHERAAQAVEALEQALAEPEQEPVAKFVSTAPERIWLDLGFDPEVEDEVSFDDLFEATWSHDNATGNGIEYVRADLTRHQARKPLTDQEIDALWISQPKELANVRFKHIRFARAVELAHGIKEQEHE